MQVRNLTFAYGQNTVLKNLSFEIRKGSVTTLLGSNGSGNSTLFKLMTKNLTAKSGGIYLDDKNINTIKLKDFAHQVSLVSQTNSVDGQISVQELVEYGRTPFLSSFKRLDDQDKDIVQWAMEITDVSKYREKCMANLSSGQQQRVWIAMALAQNTKILFLDEPTTYLDIRYQVQILQMVRRLNQEFGITVIMVLHDMNQAIQYSDQILGLKDGEIVAQGKPQEIFTPKLIEQLYGIQLSMITTDTSKFVLQA